jgi:hypothetical protein
MIDFPDDHAGGPHLCMAWFILWCQSYGLCSKRYHSRKPGRRHGYVRLLFSEIELVLTLNPTATRILASWYLLHQDSPSYPSVSFDSFQPDSDEYNAHIDVQDSHFELVREMGAASTVLLKNKNGALPLGEQAGTRSLVLIGSDAGPGRMGPNEFPYQAGPISGTLAMGWGSGTVNFTYLTNVSRVLLSTFEAKLTIQQML